MQQMVQASRLPGASERFCITCKDPGGVVDAMLLTAHSMDVGKSDDSRCRSSVVDLNPVFSHHHGCETTWQAVDQLPAFNQGLLASNFNQSLCKICHDKPCADAQQVLVAEARNSSQAYWACLQMCQLTHTMASTSPGSITDFCRFPFNTLLQPCRN